MPKRKVPEKVGDSEDCCQEVGVHKKNPTSNVDDNFYCPTCSRWYKNKKQKFTHISRNAHKAVLEKLDEGNIALDCLDLSGNLIG